MDVRRALPFLLLVICAISAVSAIRNGRDEPNNIRRIRKISLNEYLVPPPIPKLSTKIRIGRLAPPHPTETPGYFTQFMSWLKWPFGSPSESSPAPLPVQHETPPYPASSNFIQSLSPSPRLPSTAYGGPSHTTYEKPLLPSFNSHSGYPSSTGKSCNPCNKVPWMPINGGDLLHSGGANAPSPPQLPELPSLNGVYPPRNGDVTYDAHYAASQIKASDFSSASTPFSGQDGSFVGPLSNPHLYAGALPPIFTAGEFNYPVPDGNADYLSPPPSGPANNALTGNGSSFNGGHNEQSVYPGSSSPSSPGGGYQDLGYNNAGASNGGFNHFSANNDLSSSGTQVSHGHADPSTNKQISFGSSGVSNQQPSGASNNGVFYVTGPNAPVGDFLDNSNRTDRTPPSYGISGFEQTPNNYEHRYNNLPAVAKDSHASSSSTSDGSAAKIENSIHFQQSPLLDFTRKGESRTDSSSIPPTSNVVAHFESAKIAGTTLVPGNFKTRQGSASTESYLSANHAQSVTPSGKSQIDNSGKQNSGSDFKILRGQDVSYIPPSSQAGYLWSNILSTTSYVTERAPFWSPTVKSYDDVAEEVLNQNVNSKDATFANQENAKRNKKVQVIIPYTSQYTPQPFQSGKIAHTGEFDHDNYVGEESRNSIKVTSPPGSSNTLQPWPTTLEDVRKPSDVKGSNFIELHKLQKNIDNWTIQEYSKGTTVSTASPSSANPYLYPSKQIPDKYLTTTEPVNYATNYHNKKNNIFTLAGFTFNDLNYKDSASNREESQVQVLQSNNSKPAKNSTDVPATSTNDFLWRSFSIDISPVNKERVYVVTPQPIVTSPKSHPAEQKKEKAAKEAERNSKELKASKDTKKSTEKSTTFESIEKAYQVLPQAVNNLAVASTGPESVPLWGIMEHEYATNDGDEHDNEDNDSSDLPVLNAGHSKVSRARR